MNKKAILTFIVGVLVGAAGFALTSNLFRHSSSSAPIPHSETTPSALPLKTVSTAPVSQNISVASTQSTTAPVSQSVASPSFHSLLAKEPDSRSVIYTVKKGDSLTSIAKSHGTTVDLIAKINGLTSDRLAIGQRLKVPTVKFNIVVDKSQNILILKAGEEVLKTYVVSTGTNNSTPVGVFQVTDKLLNPTWYKAGAVVPPDSPENVLGTRWIGITQKGYGIHGTTEPDKLGQQVTAGCVRMRNDEVEELYGFVSRGTEVTVVD